MDSSPFYLSLQLATLTTAILLPLITPLAWWISSGGTLKTLIRVILTLPLVLPPTVLGFYLLMLLSPQGYIGAIFERWFDFRLVFTFSGMLIASVIFSIPFLLNPLLAGFESLPPNLAEAAYTLGKSKWTTLWRVQLPCIFPNILSGLVLCFAHALGEFGVILMIGGKIPGKTQVASMAVYDLVESMDYTSAHLYALGLTGFSFVALFTLFFLDKQINKRAR